MFGRILKGLLILIAVVAVLFMFGPRPDSDDAVAFQADAVGADVEAYLSQRESAFGDIRDGLQKQIVWANSAARAKTDIAIVYIHGFSASPVEIDPVPRDVASALGANLYYTRLAGHGRTGEAMGEATLQDWLNDTAEALAIGKAIGDRVIVMSASTGGTLSTWAAANPDLAAKIDGLVMVSPNFEINGAPTWMLNMPWAETILPAVLGAERSFTPENELHAAGWTSSYPSKAVFPMGALLKIVDGIDLTAIEIPAMFIYAPGDKVVSGARIAAAAEAWGGPSSSLVIEDSDDPYSHVIAGDALSPNTTERVTTAVLDWVKSL